MTANIRSALSGETRYIDPRRLDVADVVLSTDYKSLKSWGIRAATFSRFSHAAIHVGGGFLVEALGEAGVRQWHCRRMQYTPGAVRVLRLKRPKAGQLEEVATRAKRLVYRPYALGKAISTFQFLGHVIPKDDVGRFCSELVAEAFGGCLNLKRSQAESVTPGALGRCDDFDDVTESTTLPLNAAALEAGMAAYADLIEHAVRTWSTAPNRPSPEDVESQLGNRAWSTMQKFGCFTKPYHLVDVYRQLKEASTANPSEVESVDHALFAAMQDTGADENRVLARQTIPNLISLSMNPDLVLPFISLETSEQIDALVQFSSDLVSGKTWYTRELESSIEEFEAAATTHKLKSLKFAADWLRCDIFYARINYSLLERLANPHVIDVG